MDYNSVIEKTGEAIDAAGVAVIVAGGLIAFGLAAVHLSRGDPDVYRRFRQRLGQTILLGLELLVAGDIVRTVATSPNLTSVAILATIVLIRTFLSFSLEVEITGRWPWQKREVTAPQIPNARAPAKAHATAALACAIVQLVDRDHAMTHLEFRQKLDAVGYGVFVPAFFVATGVKFGLNALFGSTTNLARVPVFLAALFVARGLPALVDRSLATRTQSYA